MENKSLVALVSEANSLVEKLIESGGEITPDIELSLEANERDLQLKLDSYDFVLDRLKKEQEFFADRAKFYQNAARSLSNAEDRLKESIKKAMRMLGVSEVQGSDFKFVLSKTKSKLILDEKILPDEYKTQVISYEVNKEKISEALNAGSNISGAMLEPSYSLRKYAKSKK